MQFDKNKKIFVTGIGVISAIGLNAKENINSLEHKKHGISGITHINTIHKDELKVGEIKLTNAEIRARLNLAADNNYPRTTLLAMHAAKEAYEDAGLNSNDGFKTGVILGTTVGGMDKSELVYKNIGEDLSFIDSHHCGFTTERVADYIGAHDFVSSLSTACSSGVNAILLGARLIKHGILDRAIVGGTDALSKFTINGFRTLMILHTEHSCPFDKNRKGLNLGEGAGMIVLESEKSLNGKKVYCELSGYANNNDAFHQTASSPDGLGPYLSMKNALEMSGLSGKEIDYINVHGTGTDNNDLTEGLAMIKLFNGNVPKFSSTKAFTGHALGGAGGIESVFSILAIEHDMIFPNLNFNEVIPEINLIPVTETIKNAGVNNVMTNSFGFGGNDSTLIFSKV